MGELRFYNTLTRSTEPFTPREPGKAGLYCCGPTVYDVPHAGHARAAVAFDVLVRHLRARSFETTYVRNITDIDDKILQRSRDNDETPLALARRMEKVYQDTMASLGCLAPDHEPRVSDHLPEIHAIVGRLVEKGHAYAREMPEGTTDVYYSVRSFPGYCKLSRRKLDDMQAGARVAEDTSKDDPFDFALWKGAPTDEWGWDSPWGHGRPGWHIECSAMATRYLGPAFDIHGGGMDLVFPHHENEIAQSEAAHPDCGNYANYWVHNGFVNIDKEKMAKSLGNFVTAMDVLDRNDPEGFRWFLLSVHYRGPLEFDTDKLESGRVVFPGVDDGERRADYLFTTVERLTELAARGGGPLPKKAPPELTRIAERRAKAVQAAADGLDDDLNTPIALASVGELSTLGNELADLAQKRRKDAAFVAAAAEEANALLTALQGLARDELGLLQVEPSVYFERTRARRLGLRGLKADDVDAKVAARNEARKAKDFARSDEIRDELDALGVVCKDTPEGTVWTIGV